MVVLSRSPVDNIITSGLDESDPKEGVRGCNNCEGQEVNLPGIATWTPEHVIYQDTVSDVKGSTE